MPILKGRRISKLRPEFVIMDPKTDSKAGGLITDHRSYTTRVSRVHFGSSHLCRHQNANNVKNIVKI